MAQPRFDEKGYDPVTFSPFTLQDCRNTEYQDVRLSFDDWGWFPQRQGSDTVDGYYMNGYGVQGLVLAALFADGVDPDCAGIHPNSEGDACYIHFNDLEMAVRAARLACAMMAAPEKLAETIRVAREHGFED